MQRRHLLLAAFAALGALAAAACQPIVTPPAPTPPAVSCQDPAPTDNKTDYFAVVDGGGGTTEAVTFDAASQREKDADIAKIEATGGEVLAVEVDQPVYAAAIPNPADDIPEYANQWGVDEAGFPVAWGASNAASQGLSSADAQPVLVAVLDTGAYREHPDLGGAAVANGVDKVATGIVSGDPNGHGTHVVGILGARDNTIGGVGGAPEARIYPVRVLNSCGSGSYSTVIAGIDAAVAAGAKVISMSLGGGSNGGTALQDAVDRAVVAGIVVVAAAGNDFLSSGVAPSFPAALNGVISVAATVEPPAPGGAPTLASYSQRGAGVDIAAPGSVIRSTLNTGSYGDKSGTSMATPFVAAAAALLIAKCPLITLTQLETRLESTATPIAGNPIQTSSPSGALRTDLATAGPC